MVAEALQGLGHDPTRLKLISHAPGVKGKRVAAISEGGLNDFIQSIILDDKQETEEPFCVLDLRVVTDLMDQWACKLPMVQPFYAVKCNPNPALLGALAALGSSFDCASRAEIESILSLGVSPDRIIYANPCKSESHIKYAASVGVNITTFDSTDEIDKIRDWHPKCELLVRIKPPEDSGARSALSLKYGALPEEVPKLLQAAQAANLKVIGVSFHIGSGGACSGAFREAIAAAKSVFDLASRLGMPWMRVLDIGGGFSSGPQFDVAASGIKAALQDNFAKEPGLQIIAEPGRFFAESVFTLATSIIGKRLRGEMREYWINDGLYGSLNCILYDHATVRCTPLACKSNPENPTCQGLKTSPSTVFGPTCDSLDTIFTDYQLPELQMKDWLVFPDMGAYTTASGSNFNGFSTSTIRTYLAHSNPTCISGPEREGIMF